MPSPDVWAQVPAVALFLRQYAVVFIFAYCILMFGYRIFFHPLSKFPGPTLAKISSLYGGYHSVKMDLYLQAYQGFQKYGPVIRMGPNKLVFNSVTAIKEIYQNNDVIKSSAAYGAIQTMPMTTSTFDTINRSVHRVKRQRIAPILSPKSMRTFEPQMQEQVDILLRNLAEQCQETPGASVDMRTPLRRFTLNIVSLLAFGYDSELQTATKHQYMVDLVQNSNWRYNIYYNVPWVKSIAVELSIQLFTWLTGGSLYGYINSLINYRTSLDKHAKQDLYSAVMKQIDALDKAVKFNTQEIWSEAILFVAAGSDTSATAMASMLFYLSRNPDCKQKLLQEIQATFKSGRDIRAGAELSGLVYMRACIDEAMRMSPPVTGTLWRQASPSSGKPLIIDGHVIPPGTQFGISAYAIHHNEEYFPDPFTYKPERWLSVDGGDQGETPQANRAAFIPFSIGERTCPGQAMAFQEIYLVIAKTLWYFDFELAAKSQTEGTEFVTWDTFVGSHDELHMHFHPRGELWRELMM